MSDRRGKDGYTDEERQDGYKLNGAVLLVMVFSLTIVLIAGLAVGAKPFVAIVVAAVFSLVLTFNVRRVLERKYREKHPDFR